MIRDKWILVIVYVDNMAYTSNDPDLLEEFEEKMRKRFKTKFCEDSKRFIGYQVVQDQGRIFLHQKEYITKISETFELIHMTYGRETHFIR